MDPAFLFDRSRDEAFWRRLVVQESIANQTFETPEQFSHVIESLFSERDSCLRIASECGQFLLHLFDVSQAECQSMRAQCETLSLSNTSLEASVAEKKSEIVHLLHKNGSLADHLRQAELKIIQLQKSAAKSSSTHQPSSSLTSAEGDNFPSQTNSSHTNTIQTLRKQLKKTSSRNADLESRIQALLEQIQMLKESKTWLDSKISEVAASNNFEQEAIHSKPSDQSTNENIMLSLLQELTNANAKLSADLKETRVFLEASQAQVSSMALHIEELQHQDFFPHDLGNPESSLAHELDQSMQLAGDSSLERSRGEDDDEGFDTEGSASSPGTGGFNAKAGTSLPRHLETEWSRGLKSQKAEAPFRSASLNGRDVSQTPSSKMNNATKTMMATLNSCAASLHARLLGADTVAINRRLRRAFDLAELTRLSHSVITNIESDIENLMQRFPTATTHNSSSNSRSSLNEGVTSYHDQLTTLIHPTVKTIQTLLRTVAQLKRSVNDLSLAYFEVVASKAENELSNQERGRKVASALTTKQSMILSRTSSSRRSRSILAVAETVSAVGSLAQKLQRMVSNPGLANAFQPTLGLKAVKQVSDRQPTAEPLGSPEVTPGERYLSMISMPSPVSRGESNMLAGVLDALAPPLLPQPKFLSGESGNCESEARDEIKHTPIHLVGSPKSIESSTSQSATIEARYDSLETPKGEPRKRTDVQANIEVVATDVEAEEDPHPVDDFQDPPPDHPYWKIGHAKHGGEEDFEDPPPDHPYWKAGGAGSSHSFGEFISSLLPSSSKNVAKQRD
ncbi:hypothetical protein BJ741DRAFT_585868 [Chytriomyces cf. hyalinus JEL632]|nr:hypothetical protein BJ741DRAFT_585868 [Chytriomyces cf. hyalinus JEL632]